jgi:hypothetical protein
MMVEATDRLRLDVKVSAGNEIFSWAGDSHFSDGDIGGLAKGPFGTGPFGTFLSDIFTIPNVSFRFLGEEPARRKAQFLKYSFQVPRESSHYMVQAGGGWRVAGYEGEIQIDPNSFELRRLVVRTSELPEEADACEATTAVEYATIRIGTGDFLLPRQSTLHFLMRDATESEISATYSGCRQFVGEAKLVLQAGETARKRPPARGAPISIPAGLPIMLALEEPIDSDTAAAGDTVAAQVTSAVRENASRTVIIPAGSKVQCRVVRMEHWLDSPRYFLVALQLETIEVSGIVSPFYAILRRGEAEKTLQTETSGLIGRGRPILLRPRGQSQLIATFTFTTAATHYVMRRGYEMKWTTVLAPG